jgi:hypothetical protein
MDENKLIKVSPSKPAPSDHSSGRDGAAPSSSSGGASGRGAVRGGAAPRVSRCERCHELFSNLHRDDPGYLLKSKICKTCLAGPEWEEGADQDRFAINTPFYLSWEADEVPVLNPGAPGFQSDAGTPISDFAVEAVTDQTWQNWEERLDLDEITDLDLGIGLEFDEQDLDLERIKDRRELARAVRRYREFGRYQAKRVLAWWAVDIQLARRPPDRPHRREVDRARARARRQVERDAVLHLSEQGLSHRKITTVTGVKKSTVAEIVARSGRKRPIGKETMSTTETPTIVQRLTAHDALLADYNDRLVEVERQLGLPPGGIKAAEESLERFLASLDD